MKRLLSPHDLVTVEKLRQTVANNDRILLLLSNYLNLTPRLLDAKTVSEFAQECSLPTADAFRVLFSAVCGLDVPKNADDRRLERLYLNVGLRCLSPLPYLNDAYVKAIRFGDLTVGKWKFTHESFHAYEPFVCGHPILTDDFREIPQIGFFEKEFRFPAVLENGVDWMTVTPNEVETMKEPIEKANGRVLTYGLGLGYYAFHASQKANVDSVTVVERDDKLIHLFKDRILPQFPQKEKIRVVSADAFSFTEEQMTENQFDFAFVDLWHDQSDGLPMYIKMKRLEARFPHTEFAYWIEPTILSTLRHMVLDKLFDDGDKTEVRNFGEIATMLSDGYLQNLAPKLRKIE